MIAWITTPLALLVLITEGTLLIHLLEGRSPVLYRVERWVWGLFFGGVISAFVLFLLGIAGLPMTLFGFLISHVLLIGGLAFLLRRRIPESSLKTILRAEQSPALPALELRVPAWLRWFLYLLAVWTLLKVLAGFYDLLSIPVYNDDVYSNWNMRAKAFFTAGNLMLDLPPDAQFFFGGKVPSYPLTVYLQKVWVAVLSGGWNDAAVNSLSFVWFLGSLGILFFALLRHLNTFFATLGIILIVSLPLYLVHGSVPYVDILMGAHFFLALYSLYQFASLQGSEQRSWFLLLCVSTALMLFVKNEAMILFLPPISAALTFVLWRRHGFSAAFIKQALIYAAIVAAVLVPWTVFKISYGLTFGNAQAVSQTIFSLHPDVPIAFFNALMYSGSFLLFFPLFALVLSLTWRTWIRSTLGIVLAVLGIIFTGEFLIFYLTPIAGEALNQTGLSRGLLQLVMGMVFCGVMLLRHLFVMSDSGR